MYNCNLCGQPLTSERLEGLQFLGKQPFQYTCLSCSSEKPIKAIYPSFSGDHFIFTDKLGADGIIKEDREDFQDFKEENNLD